MRKELSAAMARMLFAFARIQQPELPAPCVHCKVTHKLPSLVSGDKQLVQEVVIEGIVRKDVRVNIMKEVLP